MAELPNYASGTKPVPEPTPVERSVSRDGAFSKPGHVGTHGKSGKWAPAKGTRFRATAEKATGRKPGRRRKDARYVQFY